MANVLAGSVPTDYETATSHTITVRETLAGASNSPRDTVLTINVSDDPGDDPFGPFTLAWTSADTERTDLTFTITPPLLEGDSAIIAFDNNSDMSSPFTTSAANDIDSSEAGAGSITFTGLTVPLPLGLNYARVTVSRPTFADVTADTSKTLVASGDTTAPFLELPTGTATGETTATLTVSTDEANGILYGSASGSAPTKAQIKAGQTSAGITSPLNFNQPVTTTGVQTHNATLLTASTTYTMHYMQEDAALNQSNIASASSFTTDAGGAAWTPLLATTPAVWWIDADNAASMTTTGTEPGKFITEWRDLSGNNRHLTPTGRGGSTGGIYTSGVQNGKVGIAYGGSSEAATAVFTIPQPFMLVVVWKQSAAATSAFGIIIDGDRDYAAASRAVLFAAHSGAGGNYSPFAGTLPATGQGVASVVNTAYHSRVVFNDVSSPSVLNASNVTLSLGTGGIVNGIALGNVAPNTPNVYICEAFIIPYTAGNVAANSATDATNVAAYTLAKWGV